TRSKRDWSSDVCSSDLVSTGQLTAAKRELTNTVKVLHPYVAAGYTVIGLEPSCTATLRSDLVELLPEEPGAREVSKQVKTVAELRSEEHTSELQSRFDLVCR